MECDVKYGVECRQCAGDKKDTLVLPCGLRHEHPTLRNFRRLQPVYRAALHFPPHLLGRLLS